MNDSIQNEINEFLSRIFPDAELCKWVQEQFCQMSAPLSHRKNKIYIWHGTGANGKSKLCQLLQGAYGSEFVSAEPLLLVSKSHMESHKQKYVNRNISMCWEEDDAINFENLKEVLNDSVNPIGDIHIMCNSLPKFTNVGEMDPAIKERINVIPFTVRFTHFPGHDVLDSKWYPHFLQRMKDMYNEHMINNDFAATPATVVAANVLLGL